MISLENLPFTFFCNFVEASGRMNELVHRTSRSNASSRQAKHCGPISFEEEAAITILNNNRGASALASLVGQ